MKTTTKQRKIERVAIGNRQAILQMCGYGYGRTKEEAIADALRRVAEHNPIYDKQTDTVWYDGGCYC